MKRIAILFLALLLCAGLAAPALAAENKFVPSISYKDGPDIESGHLDGDPVGDCLIVSTITDCRDKTTDIPQADRDLLLQVYKDLTDGTMKLPLEEDYVIRELVDVSFRQTGCVEKPHPHKEELAKEGTKLTVIFDLGVPKNIPVVVMTYINGKWEPAENVVNNGDGTVTVIFEDICPVVFCVDPNDVYTPPKTGDAYRKSLLLWSTLLVTSSAALALLLYRRQRSRRRHRR